MNVLRSLPPHVNPTGPAYDPEEDEPVLPPDWVHLQQVYELFIRFFDSSDFNPSIAKKYISPQFVSQLLLLFDNEDPRERDLLKTTLHRIYGKFLNLRAYIRRSISNIFLEFIYEREKHMGISELLEILGSIINGFAVPLKEEHKVFLEKVLLPLHRPRSVSMYYPQLSYCVNQYCTKDKDLRELILMRLFKIWPILNSAKQVLFLSEVEEIIDGMDRGQFERIVISLVNQLCFCISSQQFQVAERALYFWSNYNFVGLLVPHLKDVFPIMFPTIFKFCQSHWNTSIHGLAMNALKVMIDGDAAGFQAFIDNYRAEFLRLKYEMGGKIISEEEERKYLWEYLTAEANKNTENNKEMASLRGGGPALETEEGEKERQLNERKLRRRSVHLWAKRLSFPLAAEEQTQGAMQSSTNISPSHMESLSKTTHCDLDLPSISNRGLSKEVLEDYKTSIRLRRKSNLPMDQSIYDELSKHALHPLPDSVSDLTLHEDFIAMSKGPSSSSSKDVSASAGSHPSPSKSCGAEEGQNEEKEPFALVTNSGTLPTASTTDPSRRHRDSIVSIQSNISSDTNDSAKSTSSITHLKKSLRAKLLPRHAKHKAK
jgi:hypothetical protein